MSEPDWRAVLTPEQFRILREKGTEEKGTGELLHHFESRGVYRCVGCNAPLFQADCKFDSGCGWPAFFQAIPGAIKEADCFKKGYLRREILCVKCDGHLGHVFRGEGFDTPTNERHCVNSISIRFSPEDEPEENPAPKNAAAPKKDNQ